MAYSGYPDDMVDASEEDYEYYEKKKRRSKRRRRAGDLVGVVVLIAIIVILILLLNNQGFRDALSNAFSPQAGSYREYPKWAEFTVDRVITLSPVDTRFPMEYEVEIPTPKDIPNSTDPWLQDVRSITDTPDPTLYDTKYPDYTWMVWNETGLRSSRTLTIQYTMRTESALWTMDSSESGTVDDIPKGLVDWYGNKTREEWKIMPAHPSVVALSEQLVEGKINVYEKLLAMFDYMNEKFEYETIRGGEPKYCYETLNHFSGDCDDQSVLLVSLARAAGIPSWLEFGALYNKQTESWGGHAWARVYIPYFSSGGHVYNIDIVNDHFLFRDAFRFSEWESDGDGDHLKDYYYSYGSNFKYDEGYVTRNLRYSSDTIKIGSDGRPIKDSIPGFEVILLVPAILFSAVLMKKKRRNN
jgi:transglutaminase-like putative cysteine protease